MGREKLEREEKEEEERSGKKVGLGLNAGGLAPVTLAPSPLAGHFPVPRSSAPVTVAPSSAPVTLAPSQGSIFGILSARGLFKRNFRKKG